MGLPSLSRLCSTTHLSAGQRGQEQVGNDEGCLLRRETGNGLLAFSPVKHVHVDQLAEHITAVTIGFTYLCGPRA